MTWVDRLLGHLHRVFNREPGAALAFRVNADGTGLTWTVTDELFTTVVTGGVLAQDLSLSLDGKTIGELAQEIAAQPGYTTLSVNADVADLAAKALIEASNTAESSNGDHVYAYTSLLWAFLRAFGYELRDAKTQIGEMLTQMVTPDAEGEWADHWGTYYKVPRLTNETDAVYAARIIAEVLRPKSNAIALENMLSEAVGEDVTVREPWKELFIVGQSAPSGADKIHDGFFFAYCTLELRSQAGRSLLRDIATRNKAAGIKLWFRRDTVMELDSTGSLVGMFADQYELPLDSGSVPAQSYNNGNPVYDEWGNQYIQTTYSATPLYVVLAAGTPGADTIPIHAGAHWLISFLQGLGYMAGDTELAVEQKFLEPPDSIQMQVVQA